MKNMSFHLTRYHFEMVMRDKHEYFGNLIEALKLHGMKVQIQRIEPDTAITAGLLDDYALLDHLHVDRDNILTIQRAGYVPYWSVEKGTSPEGFRLYSKSFSEDEVKKGSAKKFAAELRSRIIGAKKPIEERGDAVLAVVQERPSHQLKSGSYSQFDMFRKLREKEPNREIYLKLDDNVELTSRDEQALEEIAKEIDAQIDEDPVSLSMRRARYIATLNGALGFQGMVWGVPTLLFGKADYHHLQTSVDNFDNLDDAFEAVLGPVPHYDRYLKWYLDENMISARKNKAVPDTIKLMREWGWEID